VEEQIERITFVFEWLRKHGLKLKPSKFHFFKREVKYLGHVISEEGVRTNPEKTQAINDWKVPRTEKELRSYLGICSYYRKFVYMYKVSVRLLHLYMPC
jgi:hypothetical protein